MRAGFLLVCGATLSACAGDYSTLTPAGPGAERATDLWWVMLAGACVILVGVMTMAIYAFRRKRGNGPSARLMLIGGGLVFPVVTMGALMAFAFLFGEQLTARSGEARLVLQAHATQWAWRFSYPGGEQSQGVLHVPANETFHVQITSSDVIHSFWAPQLGGKMDAIPGKENVVALRADRAGVYRALCAEFCGIGHAQMVFEIHAHDTSSYADALATLPEGPRAEPLDLRDPRDPPVWDSIGDAVRAILQKLETN